MAVVSYSYSSVLPCSRSILEIFLDIMEIYDFLKAHFIGSGLEFPDFGKEVSVAVSFASFNKEPTR